jgi:hypothetical protein
MHRCPKIALPSLPVLFCLAISFVVLWPKPSFAQCRAGFEGRWATTYGELILQRSGDTLTGTYAPDKRVTGKVNGKTFKGTWQYDNGDRGRFEFKHTGNGLFTGSWGSGKRSTGAPWGGRCLSMSTPEGIAAIASRSTPELAADKALCPSQPKRITRGQIRKMLRTAPGNSRIPPARGTVVVDGVERVADARYRVDPVIMSARLEKDSLPLYQIDDLRSSNSVSAEVEITIGRDGRVTDVRRIGGNAPASTYQRLDAAIRQWRYRPSTYCEKPVEVITTANVSPRAESPQQLTALREQALNAEEERLAEQERQEKERLDDLERQRQVRLDEKRGKNEPDDVVRDANGNPVTVVLPADFFEQQEKQMKTRCAERVGETDKHIRQIGGDSVKNLTSFWSNLSPKDADFFTKCANLGLAKPVLYLGAFYYYDRDNDQAVRLLEAYANSGIKTASVAYFFLVRSLVASGEESLWSDRVRALYWLKKANATGLGWAQRVLEMDAEYARLVSERTSAQERLRVLQEKKRELEREFQKVEGRKERMENYLRRLR